MQIHAAGSYHLFTALVIHEFENRANFPSLPFLPYLHFLPYFSVPQTSSPFGIWLTTLLSGVVIHDGVCDKRDLHKTTPLSPPRSPGVL